MRQADCSRWDSVDHDQFLAYDIANPSRQLVADIMRDELSAGAQSIIEVGPGSGIDYNCYIPVGLQYRGIEGSRGFLEYLRGKFDSSAFELGTFTDLGTATADIVYTRSTLEHQPRFEAPLRAMLDAAKRMVVVSWYRPPADLEEICPCNGYHCNQYRLTDVVKCVADHGWHVAMQTVTGTPDQANVNMVQVFRPQ